jgi:hypothetical protein
MAESAKQQSATQTRAELTRLIQGEEGIAERRCGDVWLRVGRYLHQLRPLVPKGEWDSYITTHFTFTPTSAGRYMRFWEEAKRRRLSNEPPMSRLSDAEKKARPDHQARGYSTWRTEQKAQERVSTPPTRRRSQEDVQKVRDFMEQLATGVTAKYRELAHQHHPDRGGNPSAMRSLTVARDQLMTCIRRCTMAYTG